VGRERRLGTQKGETYWLQNGVIMSTIPSAREGRRDKSSGWFFLNIIPREVMGPMVTRDL